ncbi:hypothetical protein Aperf_G00000056864 [Anoplocephala perfoliata]
MIKDAEKPIKESAGSLVPSSIEILQNLSNEKRQLLTNLLILLASQQCQQNPSNQQETEGTPTIQETEFDCRPFRGPKTPPTPIQPPLSSLSPQIDEVSSQRMSRYEDNSSELRSKFHSEANIVSDQRRGQGTKETRMPFERIGIQAGGERRLLEEIVCVNPHGERSDYAESIRSDAFEDMEGGTTEDQTKDAGDVAGKGADLEDTIDI